MIKPGTPLAAALMLAGRHRKLHEALGGLHWTQWGAEETLQPRSRQSLPPQPQDTRSGRASSERRTPPWPQGRAPAPRSPPPSVAHLRGY